MNNIETIFAWTEALEQKVSEFAASKDVQEFKSLFSELDAVLGKMVEGPEDEQAKAYWDALGYYRAN